LSDRSVNVRLAVEVSQFNSGMKSAAASAAGAASTIESGAAKSGKAIDQATMATGRFSKAGETTRGVLKGLGVAVAAGEFIKFGKDVVQAGLEATRIQRDTAAAIKSTGGAAHVTADQVHELAASQAMKIGVDDETIQSAENVILTFRGVRNEVGKGNDIFTQSVKLTEDLSSRMGIDLSAAALQVGKALNDPARGLARLQRVGVTFTDQQKAQVKALMDTGDVMGAQKVILRELEREFGGSAAAMSDPAKRASAAWKEFEEELGKKMLPTVQHAAAFFADDLLPAVSATTDVIGPLAGAVGSLPGPLKETLVLMAAWKLASMALSGTKLAGFFTNAGVGVRTFSRDLAAGNIEAHLAGISRAYMGVLKVGAGFVGFELLSKGMANASHESGKLETALGGAAAGFALTGTPLGALVGAGGGLLAGFVAGAHQSAAAADEMKKHVDSLMQTLDTSGHTTAGTLTDVAKALQDVGALDIGNKLGIDLSRITDAATNGGQALSDLKNITITAADGSTRSLGQWADAQAVTTSAQADTVREAKALIGAVDGQNKAVDDAVRAFKSGRRGAALLEDALSGTGSSAKTAQKAIDKLTDAVFRSSNRASQAQGSFDAYQAAIDDATQAAKDNGKTLDATTVKGRANRAVLRNLADSANTYAGTLKNGSSQQANFMTSARHSFSNAAQSMGLSKAAAQALTDRLLAMPKNLRLRIQLDKQQAESALYNFTRYWNALHSKSLVLSVTQTTSRMMGVPIIGASGGPVYGPGSTTSDSIPARLSNREHVQPAWITEKYGMDAMERIRSGVLSRDDLRSAIGFASGGPVGAALRGFNISGISQTRSDVATELHNLLVELRKAFGPDSHIVKSTERLGARMVDVAARQDKWQASLEKVMSARADLVSTAGQSMSHDIFGGGASGAFLQLRADRADSLRMRRNLARLHRMGLHGNAFRALAASGDLLTASQLDTSGEVRRFQNLYFQRAQAQQALGQFAGAAGYGASIRAMHHAITRLEHRLQLLGREVYHGTRDGINDANKAAARARR
jgi:hypothetical protein